MMNRGLFVATLLILVTSCGSSAASKDKPSLSSTPGSIPFIQWTDCNLQNVPAKVRCGVLRVYENRDARKGRVLELKFIVLPARQEPARPDPVFSIYGGPGQTATEFVEQELESPDREHREIILLDQRGTSAANALNCNFAESDSDAQVYLKPMFSGDAVKTCREELEQRVDLRYYGTPLAMDDLDDLRALLGYEKINLKGGSYGSRAILTYIQRHEAHTRSVAMVALAPFSFKNPLYHARYAQETVDKLFADCDNQAECRAAFPKLREELSSDLQGLESSPVDVKVHHPQTGNPATVRLGRAEFAEALRVMTYRRDVATMIPLAIHQAYSGDYRLFAELAMANNYGLRDMLRFGMLLCITCSEDVNRITEDDIVRETKGTFLRDDRVRQQIVACKEWPKSSLPADFERIRKSNVPALLMSGYYDPATPPRFGEEVARDYLPNSVHLVINLPGHSPQSECTANLVRDFFENPDLSRLDTSCVKAETIAPFATEM